MPARVALEKINSDYPAGNYYIGITTEVHIEMQGYLFSETGKSKKTFSTLDVSQIQHSQYNPRKNRPKENIDKLAERISKNGFEITRSIWVHAVDSHYEVFAGGTRFESAKLAKLTEIPVVLHEGFTEDEIVKLSEEDNENDEYHTIVNIVDVWLSYKALADIGWTQARIAKAKGVAQTFVSFRLKLADLPEKALDQFITKEILNEGQARELLNLLHCNNLEVWLSRETAMVEIIESVLKNDKDKITAKVFAKEVEKYNALIKTVQEKYDGLETEYNALYLDLLSLKKVRSVSGAETEYSNILAQIKFDKVKKRNELSETQDRITEEQRLLELEILNQNRKDYIISRVVNDDFRVAMECLADNSVNLIFTDPPYDEESISMYGELAEIASRKLTGQFYLF
jgi:ParB family chromosome partitioning protein